MGKHILVPVDESDGAREACGFVEREFPSATITLLHVINPSEGGYSMDASLPTASEDWYERKRSGAESLFDELESQLSGSERTVHRIVEVGKTTDVIVGYAEENDIDQIVMGSHGRSGVSRILLGSVAETVVRRSPVAVTVVR